jgi:hypothetical protein
MDKILSEIYKIIFKKQIYYHFSPISQFLEQDKQGKFDNNPFQDTENIKELIIMITARSQSKSQQNLICNLLCSFRIFQIKNKK